MSRRLDGAHPLGLPFKTKQLIAFCFVLFCLAAITGFTLSELAAAEIPGQSDAPIHLKAARLQYFKGKNIYLADGETVVEKGPLKLEADMLRFNETTRKLSAMGDIRYFDGENRMDANRIEINIDTKLGFLVNGRLFLKTNNYYISGREIIRHADDQFEVAGGDFTACDCRENPAWRIRAANLNLTVDEYLVAKHTRFYVKDVPFFYLPYFIYPAKRDRQTGLLVPRIGYSSEHGFRYKQELFIAPGNHQDATVAVEHRGTKGNGAGLQYRYILSTKTRGEINADFFQDKEDGVDRWEVRMNHEQRFSSRAEGRLDLKYQNETSNLAELSDRTAERAQQNIESNLSLTYRGEVSHAYLLARYTQDLTKQDNDSTPQRLPEIGYSLMAYRLGNSPLYLNVDSSAVHFWSESGLNLQRVDLYPKLALPVPLGPAATLTPWTGFRQTWYRHGLQGGADIRRDVIPSGLTLEGGGSKHWGNIRQEIEAELFYEHISVTNSGNLIQIDELDTVHDRENITATFAQRIITEDAKGNTETRAMLRFTETYHPDKIAPESGDTRRFSDLRTELRFRPFSGLSLEVDAFYHVYDSVFTSVSTDLGLALSPFFKLTIGQRAVRDGTIPKKGDLFNPYYLGDRETVSPEMDFWSGEAVFDTPWGVRYVNRIYYDNDEHEMVEIGHRVEYHAQCWGVGLSYVEFHDRNELSFVITLKGLGGFGPS